MDMKEAVAARHTVRKYEKRPLSEDLIRLLSERVEKRNKEFGLSMKLITGKGAPLPGIIKLFLAKGVSNYLILAGSSDSPNVDEKLGYCSADFMLFAQTLGLNTWQIGETFNKKETAKESGDARVAGIVAVGYGKTQGAPHKSKEFSTVASYKGKVVPEWFISGVEAALAAPTALNKQAFNIIGDGNGGVKITCDNGIFTLVDLGAIKYHFELGAGKENFEWDL